MVGNEAPEITETHLKGFVYLAKEFGIYPGGMGRLKRGLSFLFANNYLHKSL